jgi:hypothetical protein
VLGVRFREHVMDSFRLTLRGKTVPKDGDGPGAVDVVRGDIVG